MDKEKVLSLISDEHNLIMANPFPDEGTRKIKVDFERDFLLLEDENLDCDIYQGHLFNAIKIGLIACQKLENAHDLNLIKELNPKTKKNVHLER
ncbi:hypothetical protein [Lysinibacillus sp. NPDC056185]|uniref:hypothetical protein n=1 Tax=Lysinibacillus sp. NPDC056185 TaxID=3345739 RepID=UPI0039EF0406